ncbi:MAG: type II toxin-antitoxin system HicA family toxin [Breznakibacter sp.]|jgi:predicted RNA binding protein YcfA (HicA-like mRNA interferase family)|nr:type II toxin-antitoxin system HicA family toxin [Breznakibacter sp.]
MTSEKIIKTIEADGWYLRRVNGSHHHFRHPTKPGLVTVAHPTKDLPVKTVASIFKQAQIQL